MPDIPPNQLPAPTTLAADPAAPVPAIPPASPAPELLASATGILSTLEVAEPGTATTEFWASQAASLLLAVLGVFDATGLFHVSDQARGAILAAIVPTIGLIQAAYSIGRSVRKSGTPA